MTFTFNRKVDVRALDMFASLQQLRPRCSQIHIWALLFSKRKNNVILRPLVEPDV